jgi:hypothetical protein
MDAIMKTRRTLEEQHRAVKLLQQVPRQCKLPACTCTNFTHRCQVAYFASRKSPVSIFEFLTVGILPFEV